MSEEQNTGVISIRGKLYKTVALRVSEFRKEHTTWSIRTEIIDRTDASVLIRAEVLDETGRMLADGYAEEDRESSSINRTSAVENCQTSAIGRALASLGYVGSEFASEEEIAAAKVQSTMKEEYVRMVAHTQALIENYGVVMAIKAAIAEEVSQLPAAERSVHIEDAARSWFDLSPDTQGALYRAPTKGGVFTTSELAFMKNHFRRLAYGDAA